MPTYDYKCRDCDHSFEIQQAFTDDALTECPECRGSLRKVFGAVGISFKGSGFYKTDSRASSRSSSSGSGAADASSSESTSTSSSTAAGSSSEGGSGSSGDTAKAGASTGSSAA